MEILVLPVCYLGRNRFWFHYDSKCVCVRNCIYSMIISFIFADVVRCNVFRSDFSRSLYWGFNVRSDLQLTK